MSLASSALETDGGENVARSGWARAVWLLTAIALLSVAAQIHWGVNTNTSWNITLAEKMLDGQRANVDFFEINPPLSYLLYLAPTLAARLVGASPEFMVDLSCFMGAALCLWLSSAVLARGGAVGGAAGARLAVVAATAVLLLPAAAFNEREHIALIASLPCLAALTVIATGRRSGAFVSVLAGVGAGVAMSIKPHFALFFLPVLVYVAWRAGWRALASNVGPYIALAIVALYWIAVAAWLPAFFERVAPMVRDIYLPARKPIPALLADPSFLIWIALFALLAVVARRRLAEPPIAIPALASLGAMAAYGVQGKLWPYQAYPAMALVALAIGPLVLENLTDLRRSRRAWLSLTVAETAVGLLALAGFWLVLDDYRPELESAVAAIGPHPKLLAISPDIGTGHPLARRVHGVWVGSTFGLWITHLSMPALERSTNAEDARKYEAYMRFDREMLVADIVSKKPDAILIANDFWLEWAQSQPEVAVALADYHLGETVGDTMVYVRNNSASR